MITAISIIKNSCDVIESFVRFNANIVDNFVIMLNICDDATPYILKKMIEEGYDIEILSDDILAHRHGEKMTRLLHYAKEKYKSDVFIPLDDDEFIMPLSGNLFEGKNIIESLKRDTLYLYSWRTFFVNDTDKEAETSIPLKMNYYASLGECYYKIIIPRDIVDETFKIEEGNHMATGDLVNTRIVLDNMVLEHYPCRSYEQIKSKAILSWMSYLLYPERSSGWGYQWKYMYEFFVNGSETYGYLQKKEIVQMLTKLYLEKMPEEEVELICRKFVIKGNNLKNKYTQNENVNSFRNLIHYTEQLIHSIVKK